MSEEDRDDQGRDENRDDRQADEYHGDREQRSHGSSTDRSTAPQSGYTGRRVAIGVLVAAIGIAVTFGVPLVAL